MVLMLGANKTFCETCNKQTVIKMNPNNIYVT